MPKDQIPEFHRKIVEGTNQPVGGGTYLSQRSSMEAKLQNPNRTIMEGSNQPAGGGTYLSQRSSMEAKLQNPKKSFER